MIELKSFYLEEKVEKRNDNFSQAEQAKMIDTIRQNLNKNQDMLRVHANCALSSRPFKASSYRIKY